MSRLRRIHFIPAILSGLWFTSCVNQTPDERLNNMGPVSGPSEVSYVVSSRSPTIDLDSAVDVAQTLGRYRRLNVSEAETVRRLAQEKFDGFVLTEIRNLQPEFAARKRAIQQRTRARSVNASPAEVAKIKADEQKSLEKLDSEIRNQAVIAVKRKYGSQIAVPMKTRDNKPVVAIARIQGDKVSKPTDAVELDRKPGSVIEHQGKKTPVIGSQVPLQP